MCVASLLGVRGTPTTRSAAAARRQLFLTPKFLFGFFQKFYVTWGRWFKFFFKRTLPFKYYFMAKVLFGFTQDLSLVLGVLAFLLGSRQKYFSLGKCLLKISLKFALWLLEWSLATFNISLLPWPQSKYSLLTLPSPLDHDLHQIQQVEPPHVIISI